MERKICIECKKEFEPNPRNNVSYSDGRQKHSYCSKKCKDKAFHKVYDTKKDVRLKNTIRRKDKIKHKNDVKICEQCYSKENVEIHHITYDLENNYIKWLCRDCHRRLHRSFI